MKTIVSGFVKNLVDDICDTFQKTFLGSHIATRKTLGRTKATYIANFGILLYVLLLLHDSFNKSLVYILLFDESLSKVTQECKIYLIIRFWDDDNMVKVRYLASRSFVNSTAKNLMIQFEEVTIKLAPIFTKKKTYTKKHLVRLLRVVN